MKTLFQSLMMLLVLTLLTGVIYPLLVTGAGMALFPDQARGQLRERGGHIVASRLIAQKITSPGYFWPRPSSADYNAASSTGSNLGPTSADLKKQYEERRKALVDANPDQEGVEPPQDLLFASGSGLDPEISPAAALYQLNRVAKARTLNSEDVTRLRDLIRNHTQRATLGFIGESRVNVMDLNLALDEMFKK